MIEVPPKPYMADSRAAVPSSAPLSMSAYCGKNFDATVWKIECVKLTADELTTNFASGPWAEKFPPILTIAQAADMLQVPVGTLRFWRTTGRLNGCSRRYGRVLRFYRDRLIRWFFEGERRRGA